MTVVLLLYGIAVTGLCVFGVNCYVLCHRFLTRREERTAHAARVRARELWSSKAGLPTVTVQLPVYNERYVVERILDAAAGLDWPADRLQIQLLDDSTDDTRERAAAHVEALRARGVDVEHVHRKLRDGYKAGALRDGLAHARGEFVAVFDADFVPQPDFLHRTLPFFSDELVGLVQARWGHLNRDDSALTRAQGLAIDGHFGVEQSGRCWGGYMLNFNGTAGVWRRTTIDDAGGWQADTLTEDLDLSYRAQLRGWRVEYLPDVEVPAEIPSDIGAFKSQQRRWAKGSIQTARKLLPRVWRAPLPFFVKLQATLHLTHYLVHPLMLTVALLAPILLLHGPGSLGPVAFGGLLVMLVLGTCGPTALYVASQRSLRPDWRRRILGLPVLMLLGTGIAVSNTRAVVEALLRIPSGFVRTPKSNSTGERQRPPRSRYRLGADPLFVAELAMSAWAAWGLWLYVQQGRWLIGPFLALYACGFAWVGLLSALDALRPLRLSRLRRTPGRLADAT